MTNETWPAENPESTPLNLSPMDGTPPSRRPRLAVFGGSFDPVHNGHLCLAGDILRQHLADEVLFIPSGNPPHKDAHSLTPAAIRLEMLEQVLAPYPGMSTSDIEISRAGGAPNYTYNTLETLGTAFTEHDIFFLIGMDSLLDLPNWYRAAELISRYNLMICPRAGINPPAFATLTGKWGFKNAARLQNSVVDVCSLPISASQVRELAGHRACLAGLVPEAVQKYILEKKLYLE